MLDHSMEELREFVNDFRLNNNVEAHTTNKTTRQYSNDELIKLLESDALNMDEKQETENDTEKTAGNDSESQEKFNVLKVKECGVKRLTVEVRENLYSKFHTALSINYKTTFSIQNVTLTNANICDIAKKIEFSILSIAKDLNSYKLLGAEKVVNIEKQTRNRNVCEALCAEMELLKLRDQIRTAENKDNPQVPSNVLTTEAETISHEKSQCQVDQSNKNIPVDSGNGKSLDIPILDKLASESDEFYSCSSGGRSPTESQLNNKSCAPNSNTQDPVVNVSEAKTLEETEPAVIEDCKCVSTTKCFSECNNNCGEKNVTEVGNVLSEISSNNDKDEFHLASTERVLLSKKRKLKSQSDEGSNIQDNKENTNFINQIANTRTENSPPSKKLKTVTYKMTVDKPDSTISEEETPPLVPIPWITHESSDMESEIFSQPPAVIIERTCLIEEEIFELERARLDRECEEIKKQAEENADRDFIYGDYQRIFEIIIPIIREYYPSDYIPEEWSYGKILQRLQIDLAEAKMSDEEMASYTRDSIKTMRYLCDHCIVQ